MSFSGELVQKHLRRNYWLGVVNGAIFGFVDSVFAPSLVLALFVAQLGGSDFLIGLLPSIYNGGWFLPQFLIAHRVQQLPLKNRLYLNTSVLRLICLGLLAALTPLIGATHPGLLLVIFFVLFTSYSLLSGLGGNAFMTVVGKIIPMDRRGSFFGTRDLLGTGMGLLGGYIVANALTPRPGLDFPNNFALLFGINFAAVTLGAGAFLLSVEPRESPSPQVIRFAHQLTAARRIVSKNITFRRYLLTRFVLAVADIATPFYAIYATRQLGASAEIVGLYIGLTTFSALVSNPLLSRICDRGGNRGVMLSAATGALLMPVAALSVGLLGSGAPAANLLGLVFLIYGAARTAANISFPTFLLEIAPAQERALYIGFTNTALGIATFIPAVGGILLDLFGFNFLFLLAIALGLFGWWLASGLRKAKGR